MQLKTKHFGVIDIEENRIISFPWGLPGFENVKNYIMISNDDENSPFKWMQSVDESGLAFAVVDPFVIKKDYDININDEIAGMLKLENPEDALVYSIVVVPDDITKMTMNLKAPVIINTVKKVGSQIVLDTDRYGVRHYILEELQRQEVVCNACADKEERPVYCNK